jgi:hypothetical protein
MGRGLIRSSFALVWETSFKLIGDGSHGMPPKLGLATTVMENDTDYGSTLVSALIAKQNYECQYVSGLLGRILY